ncbi:MAG TPA: carotenoid 1,2-hydratase, partial [Gammaproteobacteria bacterium]|nr:carotenoid 1,2-hydratase [Gammaproteobacteria bacterium]
MTEAHRVATNLLVALVVAGLAGCTPQTPDSETGAAPGVTGIRYLAGSDDADGFRRAGEARRFVFPADHRPHPGFRTEWWYFTGNLFDASARHYGFELTIFRIALAPSGTATDSDFASNEIWMGHLAVTDTEREIFQATERLSRGAPGLAGAITPNEGSAESTVIVIEDFEIAFADETVTLTAGTERFGIDLALSGLDRVVAQGNDGLDPKGPEPGNASYYFSAPRLAVAGSVRSDGRGPVGVSGTAWMDREWSTSALSPDVAGWDWFALQLDDGRDLMFYRLRGRDGSTNEFSGGSIADADGNVRRLTADAVELEPLRTWT